MENIIEEADNGSIENIPAIIDLTADYDDVLIKIEPNIERETKPFQEVQNLNFYGIQNRPIKKPEPKPMISRCVGRISVTGCKMRIKKLVESARANVQLVQLEGSAVSTQMARPTTPAQMEGVCTSARHDGPINSTQLAEPATSAHSEISATSVQNTSVQSESSDIPTQADEPNETQEPYDLNTAMMVGPWLFCPLCDENFQSAAEYTAHSTSEIHRNRFALRTAHFMAVNYFNENSTQPNEPTQPIEPTHLNDSTQSNDPTQSNDTEIEEPAPISQINDDNSCSVCKTQYTNKRGLQQHFKRKTHIEKAMQILSQGG